MRKHILGFVLFSLIIAAIVFGNQVVSDKIKSISLEVQRCKTVIDTEVEYDNDIQFKKFKGLQPNIRQVIFKLKPLTKSSGELIIDFKNEKFTNKIRLHFFKYYSNGHWSYINTLYLSDKNSLFKLNTQKYPWLDFTNKDYNYYVIGEYENDNATFDERIPRFEPGITAPILVAEK